jgi:hypothetical protein
MLDERYYNAWNKNDEHGVRKEIISLLEEIKVLDKSVRKFLGPNKVKTAGVDARRACRQMREKLKVVMEKIQLTKQDYDGDYSDY